jgi:hypothetical protein
MLSIVHAFWKSGPSSRDPSVALVAVATGFVQVCFLVFASAVASIVLLSLAEKRNR